MQVFDDMEDYEYFLELLEKASKRENIEIHAYCLMPNHFHLLLMAKEPKSLSRFKQNSFYIYLLFSENNFTKKTC